MTIVVGFDPGLTGALAVLNGHDLIDVMDLPVVNKRVNATLLAHEMELWQPNQIVVENLHAMPINGSKANFSQGHSLGTIEGVCHAYPMVSLTPSAWKKAHKISGERTAQKDKARLRCIELWPEHAKRFARKKDDGRADACLIALAWVLAEEERLGLA